MEEDDLLHNHIGGSIRLFSQIEKLSSPLGKLLERGGRLSCPLPLNLGPCKSYIIIFKSDISRYHMTFKDYWIGLFKCEPLQKSPTYWLDGNPSLFRVYSGSEPNEDVPCFRLNTGSSFADKACSTLYYFICEMQEFC